MSAPGTRASRGGDVRVRVAAVVALAVAFSTVAVPAMADVTQGDIAAAEASAADAAARLRDAVGDLGVAQRRLERLEDSLVSVREGLEQRDEDITTERTEARDRIARMYMSAGGSDNGWLGIARIADLPAHLAYLAALADQDREFVNQLAAGRADLLRLEIIVEASIEDQKGEIAALDEVVAGRQADLDEALSRVSSLESEWQRQEEERRAREEAERQRLLEEERRRQEEEERRRQEEEQRKQEALLAMQAAAAAASAAGWQPGAGVEPWRPLVEQYFPAALVEDALSVMWCESKGDPLSLNRYSAASGLFQHLPYYWPSRSKAAGWEGADIFDPEANVAVAAWLVDRTIKVEQREPWGHWVCKP